MDAIRLSFGQGILADSGAWYRILQVLGEGGNATTFLVVATSGGWRGVPFAVKVFRRRSKPERRDSFLKEIAFLRECNHPAIMRVFDSGVLFSEHPFVVAEYLPKTLRAVIRADDTPIVAKISYALQLLSALQYLASLSPPVIHRDIKPENIFVKGQSCVLGDFGLMKHGGLEPHIDREVYKESVGAGMPKGYRTPDLVRYLRNESPLGPKSDVFQLGLVLAELFTGRNPLRPAAGFDSPIVLDPLEAIGGALAAGIANLINEMLVIEPDDRASPGDLLRPWQSVLLDAANRVRALEGRVF